MFSKPRVNFIASDDGFSVEILGRTGIEYREGDMCMFVDSEVLASPGIAIYTDSISHWKPPHEAITLTADKRLQIIDRISEAIHFGWPDVRVATIP